jgi:Zn-dependent protease
MLLWRVASELLRVVESLTPPPVRFSRTSLEPSEAGGVTTGGAVTIVECMAEPVWPYALAGAWFIQMGIHEGMHAEAAFRLGDDTASLLGKRTVNPLAHIEWGSLFGIGFSLFLPIYTALTRGFPMGMAWVPLNILRFERPDRDRALVSLAGPAGNFVLSAACLLVHHTILAWLPESPATAGVEALCAAVYFTSIVYGLFNLAPIPPLDGSRVLYWISGDGIRRVMDSIEPFGLFVAILVFEVPAISRTFAMLVGWLAVLYS